MNVPLETENLWARFDCKSEKNLKFIAQWSSYSIQFNYLALTTQQHTAFDFANVL